MRWSKLANTALLMAWLVAGGALAQQAATLPTVTLDRSVHFIAPDGTDVEVPTGTYQVETAEEHRLRLTPTDGGEPVTIQAQPTTHQESLGSSLALAVVIDEDRTDLVLLIPDKTALDALGSPSGVRSRTDVSRPLTAFQLNQAAGMNLKRMTPSVAPVALYPADGAVITGPSFGVQWFPGAGQSSQARYEICVTELHQSCSLPTAVIVKVPTGIILTQPSQPKQSVPFGPKPGDPNFEPPAGTTGSTSTAYGYGVTLPTTFQGKRLQWSVSACVPVTGQAAIGQIPESCTSSAPKPITWMLPAPILSSPSDDALLPTAIKNGFESYPASHSGPPSLWYHSLRQPSFAWTYINQHGIDHFLICVSKTTSPCPIQPTVQPHVVVARVQGALGFTLTHDLQPFIGQTLYWTVAACNATLGCVYQQQHRRLRIPMLIGSFVSIYEVTQNAKCKNCHEMHRENDTYLQHIQLGRFTRQDNPPGQFIGGMSNKCRNCHTASNGFADFWRAPDSQRSFERPLSGGFCSALKFEPGLSAGGIGHLKDDPLILWAVDRIPGLGRQRWHERMTTWVWRGTPCPCDSATGKNCDVHGQFIP